VPAKVADNPHIDQASYLRALDELPPVERARLKEGDWSVTNSILFPEHALSRFVDARPAEAAGRVRGWDKGYSAAGDYTVGVLMSKTHEGIFTVEDVVRIQCGPDERNRIIKATAEKDDRAALGPLVTKHPARRVLQLIERPPGAGSETTASLVRFLAGHKVRADRPVGKKEERAETFSAQVLAGNVRLVRAPWNEDYIGELAMFPTGSRDDQCDASSLAFNELAGKSPFTLAVL
jgi:predicted phage terminase large subunit-like protein